VTLLTALAVMVSAVVPAEAAGGNDANSPRRILSGWVTYWNANDGAASVASGADAFRDVSPFWFTVVNAGSGSVSVVDQLGSGSSAVRARAAIHATDVPTLVTVTDSSSRGRLAAALATPAGRAAHIADLVAIAVSGGWSGIDLDYEGFAFRDSRSTWSATRANWVTFISGLSAALHAQGKKLSVTTPPIYGPGESGGSGYWVYDWTGIAPHVDRLRIMAYDYAYSRPGPIGGPLTWVRGILDYAVTVVPSTKVVLGIAQYGRSWVQRDAAGNRIITGVCPVDRTVSTGRLTWTSEVAADKLAAAGVTPAQITRDAASGELIARYAVTYSGKNASGAATSCSVAREAWWSDSATALRRTKLVQEYQLGGVAVWALGDQDPSLVKTLRNYAVSIAPKNTALAVSAPRRAQRGSDILVTGRLRTSTMTSLYGVLQFRTGTKKPWRTVKSGRVTGSGSITATVTAKRSGQYRFVTGSTWDYLWTASDPITVKVVWQRR